MRREVTIGVYGPIGVTDIGDIAILKENINFLYKIRNKKISFKIFPLDSETTLKQVLDLKAFKENKIEIIKNTCLEILWKNRIFEFNRKEIDREINSLSKGNFSEHYDKNYIENFKKCDGIFYVDGGYFNSNWGNFLYRAFIYPLYLARYFNKVVFVSAINFGPFNYDDFRCIKKIFPVVSGVISRDMSHSRKILEYIGVNKDKVLDCVDAVFFLDTPQFEPKMSHDYVVVQLLLSVPDNLLKDYFAIKEIAKFLDYLVRTHKFDIFYIPFSTHLKGDYYQGIILQDLMEEKDCFRLLEPTINYKKIKSIIKGSKFVLSTRFHPIVFATSENVPCMSIVENELYNIKLNGAYEICNKEPRLINICEINSNLMIQLFNKIFPNRNNKLNNKFVKLMEERKIDFIHKRFFLHIKEMENI